jgi:hypothetical protein
MGAASPAGAGGWPVCGGAEVGCAGSSLWLAGESGLVVVDGVLGSVDSPGVGELLQPAKVRQPTASPMMVMRTVSERRCVMW